jgi:hypothetical protein
MKRKKLSLHVNRKVEASNPQNDRDSPGPGVYEDEIHPPGEHWYKILMPSGRIGTVHLPDELWDKDVVDELWRRFDKKAQKGLSIVPS